MSDEYPMSEPIKQERLSEMLALLAQMPPAELVANRDELFFRAGEASALAESHESSRAGRWLWPAAAAVLAVVATGLGMALMNREPQLQIVYVERSAKRIDEQFNTVVKDARPDPILDRNGNTQQIESRWAFDEIRRGLASEGMIPRQDWLALSDAFAQQMRLQQERRQAARSVVPTTAIEDDNAPRERARTYLEMRDAMQAM